MSLQFRPKGHVQATPRLRLNDATLRDLAQNNAGRELGRATFKPTYTHWPATGSFTRLELTFTLTIEMPVWTRYSGRPEAERREWDRFYRALLNHEQGHIVIFRREAETTYQRLLDDATADTIKKLLEQEVQRIVGVSDAYDNKTDHGRKQNSSHGTTIIVVP
jgi:hypothetical protein